MARSSSRNLLRIALAIQLAFVIAPLLASEPDAGAYSSPDVVWNELRARAAGERKPLVVLFETEGCTRCSELESVVLAHPAIVRRLPGVIFATLPAGSGPASELWGSAMPGVAYFDSSGTLRSRWLYVPGTTGFGVILDAVVAVAPHFEQAIRLSGAGERDEAELEVAAGLSKLGRTGEAREALERVLSSGSPERRQLASVAIALLEAGEGRYAAALERLRPVVASPASPRAAADAWIVIGAIHRERGESDEAIRAFRAAAGVAGAGATAREQAQRALAALEAERSAVSVIRILPPPREVVSGRQPVRTRVSSPSVSRVSFSLDGREVASVTRPPFSTRLDFGAVPQRHSILAVAFDTRGKELGRHELAVNDAGETFWLKLIAPREGEAAGAVHVEMNLRVPPSQQVRRVAVTWNDAERKVLSAAPWGCVVDIPAGKIGILRAVAELDDGRTAEDAVLLNAPGFVDRSNVLLAEIPITVLGRNGTIPEITEERIKVTEGKKARVVDSISTAGETRLTVGLLLDTSESMQRTLPDLQEAAIRFLESLLGERDRAFLVTFDTRAQVRQPATSDVAMLRRQIMSARPRGLTALNDAMALGLLQFEGVKGRRALIVFSDGFDVTSRYTANEVAELARRVNVPVHVIASIQGVPASPGVVATTGVENEELNRVAKLTGGSSHTLTDLASLPGVYSKIETALRAQLLAFVRTDPATKENEWRSIRVEVDGRDLDVYAPAGYCATW